MPRSIPDQNGKIDEVHYLADNFDIPPIRAAELVAEGAEVDELAAQAMLEERQRDPLADMPIPNPDKNPQHVEKRIEDLEKPVVHDESAPS